MKPAADLPGGAAWPAPVTAGPPSFSPNLSLVVGRTFGTVSVNIDGELDEDGCQLLELLLADLIVGQGNRTVAVDLAKATIAPGALAPFLAAAHWAARFSTRFVLQGVPSEAQEALRAGGLSDLMEVVPSQRIG